MQSRKRYTSEEKTKILRDLIDNNLLISAVHLKQNHIPHLLGNDPKKLCYFHHTTNQFCAETWVIKQNFWEMNLPTFPICKENYPKSFAFLIINQEYFCS